MQAISPLHIVNSASRIETVEGIGIKKSIRTLLDLGMIEAATELLRSIGPVAAKNFSKLVDNEVKKAFLSTLHF